jgi:hypothetical protein
MSASTHSNHSSPSDLCHVNDESNLLNINRLGDGGQDQGQDQDQAVHWKPESREKYGCLHVGVTQNTLPLAFGPVRRAMLQAAPIRAELGKKGSMQSSWSGCLNE